MALPHHSSTVDETPVADFLHFIATKRLQGFRFGNSPIPQTFIPQDELEDYLTVGRLQALMESVCHKQFTPREVTAAQARLRIFSILLIIDQGHLLQHCIKVRALSDDRLPFESAPSSFLPETFERFNEEQWAFCAHEFQESDCDVQILDDTILPLSGLEKRGYSRAVTTSLIQIHPYYCFCATATGDEPSRDSCTHEYVIKTYDGSFIAELSYRNELDAFQTLGMNEEASKSIVKFYGSFTQQHSHNVVLEFADQGTLADYYQKFPNPMLEADITDFWEHIFNLGRGLAQIHDVELHEGSFHGVHQDIKPSNILVFSDGETSPYRYTFKLADLGHSHFGVYDEIKNEDHGKIAAGTQTYGPPDHHLERLANHKLIRAQRKGDVWSLACVYSEASSWVTYGSQAIEEYRKRRTQALKRVPGFKDGDCFHNGNGVLPEIESWHAYLAELRRTNDRVTPAIWQVLLQDCFDSKEPRLWAVQLLGRTIDLLNIQKGFAVKGMDQEDYELDSTLSTLIGSLDSIPYAEKARDSLSRLFREDSRLKPFLSTIVNFSALGQQRLSDILNHHFKIFAHDLVKELQAKKGTTNREACKFVLYHATSLAGEIGQSCYSHERREVFSFLHSQSKDVGRSDMTRRFLDEQGAPSQSKSEETVDANGDIEDDSSSDTTISDQLDHQPIFLEGLLKLFEQSASFVKMVDGLWSTIQNDLFDWWSIDLQWRKELGESPPMDLRYLAYKDIRHVGEQLPDLFDRVQLALERFTGQQWDWWPFASPKRPLSIGKTRLEWDSCCGRIQSFDVSWVLAIKIEKFTQVAVEARKDAARPATGIVEMQEPDQTQPKDLSHASSPLQAGSKQTVQSEADPSQARSPSSYQNAKSPTSLLVNSSSRQHAQSQSQDSFVLLCVRNMFGPNSLRHCQIKVPKDMTDNSFFEHFRKHYRDLRGWFYWLHPDQFWFCHCSKFYKWDVDKISWESHEMPGENSYTFIPKPPSTPYSLPISRDEWEHRYHQNCSLVGHHDFVDRLPKRDERFPIDTCIKAHQVWGLYAEYRTSARVVLAWSFIIISPGIMFFILWLVRFTRDLQSASVPTMLILSLAGLPLGLTTLSERFKGIQTD